MEKGKPKLGVRFWKDEIEEIQGELNNSKIPYRYYDLATSYLKDFKLSDNAEDEIKALNATKAKVEEIIKKFPNGINSYPPEKILETFGIECKKDDDGLLIISHYKANMIDYSLSDFGVDENRLFKYIKKIEGDVSFVSSNLTDLGSLQYIGGNVDFGFSQITSTGNLQYIGKGAYFGYSKITDFGCLKSCNIGKKIYFNENEKLKNLWIETVKKQFPDDIKNATTKEVLEGLGIKYKQDDDGLFIISDYKSNKYGFNFSDLGIDENKLFKDIKRIEGDADFANSSLTGLGSLQYIGGKVNFFHSQITDLGNLEYIGGDAIFYYLRITSLGKLKYIGGKVHIQGANLKPSDFDSVEVKGKK